MHPVRSKKVIEEWLWEAARDRDGHGLVIFIPVFIDHNHNLPQLGEYAERIASDQVGVLQGDVWRQQGFWNAAAVVHDIQA